MNRIELARLMRARHLSIACGPEEQCIDHCIEAIKLCIPPASKSDRTCLANLGAWLSHKCESGHEPDELLPRVIDFALEATSPKCKNPPAVFMSILKKELKYPA